MILEKGPGVYKGEEQQQGPKSTVPGMGVMKGRAKSQSLIYNRGLRFVWLPTWFCMAHKLNMAGEEGPRETFHKQFRAHKDLLANGEFSFI